jgi:parallel beta-helix repeat protein
MNLILKKMLSLHTKAPVASKQFLIDSGATIPMAISALGDFAPLNKSQIENKIKELALQTLERHEYKKTELKDTHFNNRHNFSAILDQNFIKKYGSIKINNCHNFTLQCESLEISPNVPQKYLIEINDCSNFFITGLSYSHGRNMVFIINSKYFSIKGCRYINSDGSGIILSNSSQFNISECYFYNNLASAILLIGAIHTGAIQDCIVSGSHGFFNHDAAIHCCSTSQIMSSEDHPQHYHEPVSIIDKPQRSRNIIIRNCTLTKCRAQGIYLEGATNCLITENNILENNKEGICFDWGSSYNILTQNTISLNGDRSNLSDHEIGVDYILEYPLLADGSSSMKLPGVSLDNGCLNDISKNKITNNYGGGLKMIRSSILNHIVDNYMIYNALGSNKYIPYYHGVSAMGLGEINNEFDLEKASLLDFLPSNYNYISHNTILERWRPFYLDKSSNKNHIAENILPKGQHRHSFIKTTFYRIKCLLSRKYENSNRKRRL